MRSLGFIDGRKSTESFIAYLLTQKIRTHIESVAGEKDRWEIWIKDEDQISKAREELTIFVQNPSSPKYASAVIEASQLLEEQQKRLKKAASNVRRVQPQSRVGFSQGRVPPLTLTLAILCFVVSLVNNFGSPALNNSWGRTINNQLTFVNSKLYEKTKDPAASLKRGEFWRAITPIFLHANAIHLALNLFMFVSLGRLIEQMFGTPRFALFILVLAILPNMLQGLSPEWLHGNPRFGGISGVVYGMFGFVWIRSMLHPEMGVYIPMPFVALALGSIFIGLAFRPNGWNLADLCHLGGLVVGMLVALIMEQR